MTLGKIVYLLSMLIAIRMRSPGHTPLMTYNRLIHTLTTVYLADYRRTKKMRFPPTHHQQPQGMSRHLQFLHYLRR